MLGLVANVIVITVEVESWLYNVHLYMSNCNTWDNRKSGIEKWKKVRIFES